MKMRKQMKNYLAQYWARIEEIAEISGVYSVDPDTVEYGECEWIDFPDMSGKSAGKLIKALIDADFLEWDGYPLAADNKPLFNKYRRYSLGVAFDLYHQCYTEIGVRVTDYYRHPRKPKETAMCQPRKPREPREEAAR